MGKQINQYTKTRIKTSTQSDDLMDLDSTEDSGVTFESAKMKVSEFIGYILEQIPPLSLYVIDGTISANRTVTALGRFTKWVGGNITVKMADAINNYGFTIEDNLGVEKAKMGYDQATASGLLEVKSSLGTLLAVNDNFINVGGTTQDATEILGLTESVVVKKNTINGELLRLKSTTDGIDKLLVTGNSFKSFAATHIFESHAGDANFNILSNSGGVNPKFSMFVPTFSSVTPTFRIVGSNKPSLQPLNSGQMEIKASVGCTIGGSTFTTGAMFDIRGANTLASGNSLRVNNSTGTSNSLVVKNNGNVGIGTLTPNASAKLEVSSTTQGFLKPVMTTAQRDAIATPADGLEIFNTSTAKMNFYDGDVWRVITSS